MSIVKRAALTGFICLIMMVPLGPAWGADRRIQGVNLSPDLKNITIKCDGPIERHSSFVIQRPYRLVLDLESTALGAVPARISVGREPISEIRLGHANDRARVAIDFGDHVVPPFKIEKTHDGIVVRLSPGTAPPRSEVRNAVQGPPMKPARPSVRPIERTPRERDASGIVVKDTGISNNMIYLELTTRKSPNQSYRLVIDMDAEAMRPKLATVSDSQGNMKKFEVSEAKEIATETAPEPVRPVVGPRKTAVGSDNQDSSKKKFKWGMQSAAQSSGPAEPETSSGLPFRVEEFQLRKRQTAATTD